MTRPGTRGTILLWGGDSAATDSVDVSIRYGDDHRLAWVQAIRSNIPVERRAELERILSRGVVEQGPADWGMRVRLVGGRIDAVLPSVVCEAQRSHSGGRTLQPFGTQQEVIEAQSARGRRVELAVALDAAGRVTDVRLYRSSGSRLWDQQAVDFARNSSYRPKLHDGIGIPSVILVPLVIPRR